MVEDTNGISWPTAQWGMCPVRHPQGTSIKGSSGCVGGIWLFDIISDMASSQEFVEGRMNCHMGMYQNQSCYIWGDEHPFTSYLGFTRVPRFWLIPISPLQHPLAIFSGSLVTKNPSKIITHHLVGGWPTPLKNHGIRQLGSWNSQYIWKKTIQMFQSTNQS